MTVKELIEKLQGMPQDAEVYDSIDKVIDVALEDDGSVIIL